jgi:hypothetical protein
LKRYHRKDREFKEIRRYILRVRRRRKRAKSRKGSRAISSRFKKRTSKTKPNITRIVSKNLFMSNNKRKYFSLKKEKKKVKSISILLGAGFSAPKGYPVGSTLNTNLLNLTTDLVSFSPDGRLTVSIDGTKPDFGGKTSYDIQFEFCLDLIDYFNKKKGNFDYEEFYDYLIDEAINDKEAEAIAEPYLANSEFSQLVYGLKNIFNQLVSYHIKDSEGNKWHDNQPFLMGNTYDGYTGILRYLKNIKKDTVVNIYTLNHDLFFESLNNTEFFSGEICDGFEEIGSPYYGVLEKEGRSYKCRLQQYTGNYNKKYRLYKLHGSIDYGVYSKLDRGFFIPENYIKTRYGIGFLHLLKEGKKGRRLLYENCWINYHSDFLTGTTSKIERYEEPLLYKKLFEIFRANLRSSEKLIIIGYGAKDLKINEMIFENFDFNNKESFIIDPFPNEVLNEFAEKLKAKLINKQLEIIVNEDLE